MQAFIIIVIAAAISFAVFYLLIKYAVIAAIEYTGLGKAARKYTGDTKQTLKTSASWNRTAIRASERMGRTRPIFL